MKANIKNTILLIIRLYVGYVIAKHGYDKLGNMDGTISMLSGMTGLTSPIVWWAVALGELLSGLGLIFGVWTRLAAAGAAIIMAGVVYYTNGSNVVLLLGTLILLAAGGGKWALVTCKPKAPKAVDASAPQM